ncbi:hypothetical protein [Cellulomonas soli]
MSARPTAAVADPVAALDQRLAVVAPFLQVETSPTGRPGRAWWRPTCCRGSSMPAAARVDARTCGSC